VSRPAESRFVSASFVDDADGFVAAFGSLTEWNHVDRAGNDLAGVAPIAEGTHRLRAGSKAQTGSQPDRADPWCCLASSSVCCP
jgi:hypothetical protein